MWRVRKFSFRFYFSLVRERTQKIENLTPKTTGYPKVLNVEAT